MNCPGLHCDGCGRGGGPAGLLVVVAVLAVAAGVHAAWHGIETALEILVYTLAGLAGLGVVAVAGYATYRYRSARRTRYAPSRPVVRAVVTGVAPYRPPAAAAAQLEAPRPDATAWLLSRYQHSAGEEAGQ